MKKFLFSVLGIFCLVIAGNFVFAQNNHYPSAFIDAFQACKPYTLTIGPVNMMGMQVTTKKQIVGIKNGLCSYVEVVGPVDAKNTIRCNFNQTQINKLVSDMKNNTTSAWYEYYNNPSVCKTYTPGWN